MNDFDEKLSSMWKSQYANSNQLFCFVPLQRDVKKRPLPKESKESILANIDYLAESVSEEEFSKRLFFPIGGSEIRKNFFRWELMK